MGYISTPWLYYIYEMNKIFIIMFFIVVWLYLECGNATVERYKSDDNGRSCEREVPLQFHSAEQLSHNTFAFLLNINRNAFLYCLSCVPPLKAFGHNVSVCMIDLWVQLKALRFTLLCCSDEGVFGWLWPCVDNLTFCI